MIDHGEADQALYECEDCGIVLPIGALESGCPRCGETMVPHAQQAERERERDDPACHRGIREAGGGVIDLKLGDAMEILPTLEAGSVDAVVCDPPYELNFMGRSWDKRGVSFDPATWRAVGRVLKTGRYMLAFGGTRTFHRIACAIEDAGFEIRDTIMWLHGQGFPKAKSCLKPAWEPVILARKPGGKVPALEIDRCRIGWDAGSLAKDSARRQSPRTDITGGNFGKSSGGQVVGGYVGSTESPTGRYPANLILSHIGGPDGCREVGTRRVKTGTATTPSSTRGSSYAMGSDYEPVSYADPDGRETVAAWECVEGCPIRQLDETAGDRGASGQGGPRAAEYRHDNEVYGEFSAHAPYSYDAKGGPSRFFYCPKASRSDRGPDNTHPTCKNTDLMSWLARLITPAGGTVLDPFLGSGSTGVACIREGFSFIGIERDPEYFRIAEARISRERAKSGNLLNLA